jgi:hypothetical protein
MPFTEMDRTVIEIRELLAKTRNKDQVVRIMKTRGMDEQEAHDLVYSIYKEVLSVNRKSSLLAAIGCGAGFLVFGVASLATAFMVPVLVIITGIVFLGFLWGAVKLCTANGYELDED